MGSITFQHQIENSDWFDANPVMNNYITLRNEINGFLDENNFLSSMDLNLQKIHLSDFLHTNKIALDDSLVFKHRNGRNYYLKDNSKDNVFAVGENKNIVIAGKCNTLPVGTIITFAGTFTNNTTIPGWYVCDGNNGTENLVDRFIRGDTSSGDTGGSDDITICLTHNHTASSGNQNASHTHSVSTNVVNSSMPHTHRIKAYENCEVSADVALAPSTGTSSNLYTQTHNNTHSHSFPAPSIGNNSASHNHTITVNNYGSSGTDKNIPAYHTLLFIQRIS